MRNEKLITAREEREWTQEKAAEKIGVSRVTYARWEEKGVIPHLSTLGMACAAFKMTSDTLRAWLAAEEAEVQADIAAQETMSNTRACFKALERAEMFAGQIGSEEDT